MGLPGLSKGRADRLYASRRSAMLGYARNRPSPSLVGAIHPNPPTIGAVINPSAISGGQTWAAINSGTGAISLSWCTVYGATGPIQFGASFPDSQFVTWTSHTRPVGIQRVPVRIRFWFDGTQLEVRFGMYNLTGNPQIFVDGMYVAAPSIGTTSPHDAYLPITFADRRPRLIEIRTASAFGGVRTGPLDTVWPVAAAPKPRCILLGDSYTDQSSSTGGLQGYGNHFADVMGWPDTWLSGVGGSGFLNDGQGVKLGTRLQNDCLDQAPDVVGVLMGHNDASGSAGVITAAAADVFARIRAALPDAYLFVTGPLFQGSNLGATYAPVENAVFAAATGYADTMISTASPFWITGSGRAGATTGSGNADLYVVADGVHYTDAGHAYFGRRLAESLSTAIGL